MPVSEHEPLPAPMVYDFIRPATNVGVIITDTTWTLAGSPYVLTSDTIITTGVTLTIEPGVIVKGDDDVELKVLGHLVAIGTPTQPITFTSATDTGPNQWSGLVFDGGTGDLRDGLVRYGGDGNSFSVLSNIAARNVLSGELRIESSVIRKGGDHFPGQRRLAGARPGQGHQPSQAQHLYRQQLQPRQSVRG